MRLGNVQNTAGVNHSCCCTIAEILWSCSHLPEITKFLKIGDSYIFAARGLSEFMNYLNFTVYGDINLWVVSLSHYTFMTICYFVMSL